MTFADAGSLKPGGQLMVVGHRGSSGTAPENTMAAFTSAVDVGVEFSAIAVMSSGGGV